MKFTLTYDQEIADDSAHLVMQSDFGKIKALTVVHKDEFSHKLGGTRFVGMGSIDEAFHLAKGMSEKCLACMVPVDGLKTLVVSGEKYLTEKEKAHILSQHIARCIQIDEGLIFGPDMGSPESVMDATFDQLSSNYTNITGLSKNNGGLEINKNRFTAYGVYCAIEQILPKSQKWNYTLQGYGEVGSGLTMYLREKNYCCRAINNVNGVLIQHGGIELKKLNSLYYSEPVDCLKNYKSLTSKYHTDPQILFTTPTDILIPAARTTVLALEDECKGLSKENPDVLGIESVIKNTGMQYIVEVANHPLTYQAENYAEKNGIVVLTDFIINCGGMLGCYTEWQYRKKLLESLIPYEDLLIETQEIIKEVITKNVKYITNKGVQGFRELSNDLLLQNRKLLG